MTNFKEKIKQLTPEQYRVTQENGTELPNTGEYCHHFELGIYVDIVSGEPLFASKDKFDSSCGWPSFSKPITEDIIQQKNDTSHAMIRTEIRSKQANSHLGHVFEDGPIAQGGLRYCVNSAALKFIPIDKMQECGYADYIKYLVEDKDEN